MKKLPIGIQTFSQIREDNYVYIDKTKIACDLIQNGKYYFLSRPRRFGKSLFLSTLKSIFTGSKELFQGLYIYDKYDWSQVYPVISISFAGGTIQSSALLDERISNQLLIIAAEFDIKLQFNNIPDNFHDLIRQICKKLKQKVVILVDEYDKPILDNITDTKTAVEMREGLKNFYSVIKDCDEYIKFAFLTGVSKFSRVSIFSGLNNLDDITIDKKYATICGYTQADLEREFKEYLVDCDLEEIKKWYNGYSWLGEGLYNPFDILLFFAKGNEYRNYWFETGTPTFLIDLLQTKNYYIAGIENLWVSEKELGSFNIENIEPETLLFQSGYLTIIDRRRVGSRQEYMLTYPNLEVKYSLNDHVLSALMRNTNAQGNIQGAIMKALQNNDLDKMKSIVHSFFASIPNDWYRKNSISDYEGYYASIFYCCFASLGLDVIPEDTTNHGKIDLTLKFNNIIYIFEFKVIELVKDGNSALRQIKEKKYYEKYSGFKNIYLIGIEFSREDRNITSYEWEKLSK